MHQSKLSLIILDPVLVWWIFVFVCKQKNFSATKNHVWLIQTEDTKLVFLLLETNSNLDERKHYNCLIYSSI